jgi:acyl-CoA reductase-like NAD-dependent aldehyde dehydrogenase
MADRLPIEKTYKLFIGGKFPRSESGRSMPVTDHAGRIVAHLSLASRKDLRDAVEAAHDALPKWSGDAPGSASAMLRSQIMYRVAEMMEGKREELVAARAALGHGIKGARSPDGSVPEAVARGEQAGLREMANRELSFAIDRLIHYAGWCDKYQQVLGSNNPVAGPYYNFTSPEPVGVVAVVCPDDYWALLPLMSLLAPVLAAGNTAVVLANPSCPIPACIFAEACATGDVPAGVINILTGTHDELIPHIATHRGIDGVHGADLPAPHAATLRGGAAENLKRVTIRTLPPGSGTGAGGWFDPEATQSPWWIEPFTNMKTVWHPSGA